MTPLEQINHLKNSIQSFIDEVNNTHNTFSLAGLLTAIYNLEQSLNVHDCQDPTVGCSCYGSVKFPDPDKSANKFELTPENYDSRIPTVSLAEAARLSTIERHRIFISLDDIALFQCVISQYMELSDPKSQDHIKAEQWGYMLESMKSKFKNGDK